LLLTGDTGCHSEFLHDSDLTGFSGRVIGLPTHAAASDSPYESATWNGFAGSAGFVGGAGRISFSAVLEPSATFCADRHGQPEDFLADADKADPQERLPVRRVKASSAE